MYFINMRLVMGSGLSCGECVGTYYLLIREEYCDSEYIFVVSSEGSSWEMSVGWVIRMIVEEVGLGRGCL